MTWRCPSRTTSGTSPSAGASPLLAIGGIALVVAVLLVLTAMANGFRVALRATGSTENAIVTQRGSTGELTSGMTRDNANTIMVDSRVARDARAGRSRRPKSSSWPTCRAED